MNTRSPTPDITLRLVYHGQVQGVGFRAAASSIAGRFRVRGYVRNQADGTVELVATGIASEVDRFLLAVSQRWDGYIQSVEREPYTLTEVLPGFSIRR